MKKQQGMTTIGWVVVTAIVLSYVLLGIKVFPAYTEFFSVKKILATMAKDAGFEAMTAAELRESFERRIAIDYVSSVTSQDLEITKDNGTNVVSVEYAQKIPLFYNVSLYLDFQASTKNTKSVKSIE